jgi:hypothetical protein
MSQCTEEDVHGEICQRYLAFAHPLSEDDHKDAVAKDIPTLAFDVWLCEDAAATWIDGEREERETVERERAPLVRTSEYQGSEGNMAGMLQELQALRLAALGSRARK